MVSRAPVRLFATTCLAVVAAVVGACPMAQALPLMHTFTSAGSTRPLTVSAPVDSRVVDGARLVAARNVLAAARPLTVSVLCDSIGNDPGEWVSKWAEDLSSDRVVVVRHFDWASARWRPTPEIFSPSQEPVKGQITVWNFGWPGGTPLRAAQNIRVGVPVKPDLALISFGHNVGPQAVPTQYSSLEKALTSRWGKVSTVTTLAHMSPQVRPGQAEARVRLMQWLQARRLPYVDERTVFDRLKNPQDAFVDVVHPNQLGYRMLSDLLGVQLSPSPRAAQPAVTFRPESQRAALVSYAQSRGNRTTTSRVRYAFRDGFGRPMAHAWVTVRLVGPRGTTASVETDASGRVTATVQIATGTSGVLFATATDGFTTLSTKPGAVRAR